MSASKASRIPTLLRNVVRNQQEFGVCQRRRPRWAQPPMVESPRIVAGEVCARNTRPPCSSRTTSRRPPNTKAIDLALAPDVPR